MTNDVESKVSEGAESDPAIVPVTEEAAYEQPIVEAEAATPAEQSIAEAVTAPVAEQPSSEAVTVMPAEQPSKETAPAMPAEQQPVLSSSTDPIQMMAITVKMGRMIVDVAVPERHFRYTTPRLAAFVEGSYPDLPHHACINDAGPSFGAVMESTSIAHMLEHLVISLQTRATTNADIEFVGTTEWLDETAGIARVEVSFRDDLQALRAFNEATRFLNIAVLTCLS